MLNLFGLAGVAINWQRWLAWGVAALAVASTIWLHGYMRGERKLQDYKVAQAQAAIPVIVKQGAVTTQVVTRYRDRIVKVKGETEIIKEEVLVYVQPIADPVLSVGWRVLHDSAATGAVPPAPGGIDVTAPAIASSQALAGVIENYGTCKENSLKLLALQEWVRYQYAVMNGTPLPY